MGYISYGCEGYAGGVKPDVEVIHAISMFDIDVEKLADKLAGMAIADQQTTTLPDGDGGMDTWITTLYTHDWIKVEYIAADQGLHEICLYGPAQPTI